MIRSIKTMFLLSFGLLCISAGTVIRAEDGEKKSTEKVVVTAEEAAALLEEANSVLAIAKKSGSEEEIANALEELEKANLAVEEANKVALEAQSAAGDLTPGEGEPGSLSSFWNGTCQRTNSVCTFIGANKFVSVFSLIGVYASLNWINSVCNSCEESCVRRRPRFSGSDNEN